MQHSARRLGFLLLLSLTAVQQIAAAQSTLEAGVPDRIVLAPTATENFYLDRTNKLIWESEAHYAQLIQALQELDLHGLDPTHYHLASLKAMSHDVVGRDRLATDAWFSAAAHMLYGKLDPLTIEPDWTAAKRQADLPSRLQEAIENNSVLTSLSQFAPMQNGYHILIDEYSSLRELAGQSITLVPAGPALKLGMQDARVAALQSRLVELEFLSTAHITQVMDEDTTRAVKLFQIAMDLDDDGIVGTATRSALNRTQQDKIDQLRVNLERWRWLPSDLGRRHVQVNIAAFSVSAWNEGVVEQTHLAIVGKAYRKTPVFSDEIEYLIFNPWWEVPASIAAIDKLPLFKDNPGLVEELGFKMLDRNAVNVDPATVNWSSIRTGSFPYRLRQSPGPLNALGRVKIMFPNVHNVYIHDTPTQGLFAQRQRAFSSGCVRTQDPLTLAAWLLADTPDWSRERIDSAVESKQEARVNLATRIPVHVLYFTVTNEAGAGVRYLDDIYQRDAAVLDGLRKELH